MNTTTGLPPHDAEAERAVVGAVLRENSRFGDVAKLVGPGDFYVRAHQIIFGAIGRLVGDGAPADLVSVGAALRQSADYDAACAELLDAADPDKVPSAANAEYDARIVAGHARRRRIMGTALDAARRAGDLASSDGEIAEALAAVSAAGDGAWRGVAEAVLVNMADVVPVAVRWVWPVRIPLGKLTLLAGDPGLGKSVLSLDIAARVSCGAHWPGPDAGGDPAPVGNVILLSAEDDKADTIRPRLDAAGADVRRIVVLDSIRGRGGERGFTLADLPILDKAVADTGGVNLVVIDPLSAYLGAVDSHKNAEVRSLLGPLAALAAARGVALLAITHLCKGGGQSALYRAMGSLGFVAAARAYWVLSRDPDDPKRVLMLPGKQNLAPDVGGLAFRVEESPDFPGVPVLAWEDHAVTVPVDEVLGAGGGDDRRAVERAAEWLGEALADGPVSMKELQRMARESGHAWPTVERAKNKAGINSDRQGFGPGAVWYWALPDPQPPATP